MFIFDMFEFLFVIMKKRCLFWLFWKKRVKRGKKKDGRFVFGGVIWLLDIVVVGIIIGGYCYIVILIFVEYDYFDEFI